LRHIRHCLRELDLAQSSAQDPAAVELAIWFHDAIYDPTRHDNEERSAEVMAAVLRDARLGEPLIDRVGALIVATKHAQPPTDADAQLLLDIDLSIFGQSVEDFDAYERAIRLEYQHVASDAFRAGRAGVLRKFLARPHIYFTPSFKERYEWPARRNLQRSIERLALSL
jgi:predicted metal-dependent HD superfamily phosphohydrolase